MPGTIYVINGPNLNLLGTREPETYGRATLADIEKLCAETAKRHGYTIEFRQSNREGEVVRIREEEKREQNAGGKGAPRGGAPRGGGGPSNSGERRPPGRWGREAPPMPPSIPGRSPRRWSAPPIDRRNRVRSPSS